MAAFPPELTEFTRQLVDLRTRSQQKIKNLTQLADELQANYCDVVVQILNEEIKNAKLSRIQALFSLVDSILKKVSKEYKVQIGRTIGQAFGSCLVRADDANKEWLGKMVSLSWKKHGLLSEDVIAELEQRLAKPAEEAPKVVLLAPLAAPLAPSYQPPVQPLPAVHLQPPVPSTPVILTAVPVPVHKSMPSHPHIYPQQAVADPTQRRLSIVTKIVENQSVSPEEMSEITQVPEIRTAIGLQHQGKRREAMELFAIYKTQLESPEATFHRPSHVRPVQAEPVAKRSKTDDEDRAPEDSGDQVDGFQSQWVRNFLRQMGGSKAAFTVVGVGRRIVSQVSDQVAFVDEMHPKEVLLLLRFIYMLETHLKKTIAVDSDLSQRVPYTFTQLPLMLEPPAYGLIRAYFDEYPYQCSTCGRRFSNQSALSQHHDKHFRRNTALEKGISQGWMESISTWVGREVVLSDFGRKKEEVQRIQVIPEVHIVEEKEKPDEKESSVLVESVPYNEVQPACPVCGEDFDIEWNAQFCDWGCLRAVALDPDTHEIIDFRGLAVADGGSSRRIGDAVIYHRTCADAAEKV